MTRIALDSNVLAYFLGVDRHPDDGAKVVAVRALIRRLKALTLVAPAQALGETYNVMLKAGFERPAARDAVERLRGGFDDAPTRTETLRAALDLAAEHRLQIWDAIILSAAAEAGCAILLSEDMQAGFSAGGVEVVDPFASPPARRLARLLG